MNLMEKTSSSWLNFPPLKWMLHITNCSLTMKLHSYRMKKSTKPNLIIPNPSEKFLQNHRKEFHFNWNSKADHIQQKPAALNYLHVISFISSFLLISTQEELWWFSSNNVIRWGKSFVPLVIVILTKRRWYLIHHVSTVNLAQSVLLFAKEL